MLVTVHSGTFFLGITMIDVLVLTFSSGHVGPNHIDVLSGKRGRIGPFPGFVSEHDCQNRL